MSMTYNFDAIVVGSGITGGWAAKALTEQGLKVLMIERGRKIEHQTDYTNETKPPWDLPFRGRGNAEVYKRDYAIQSRKHVFDEWTQDHFVNDRENPYTSESPKPFEWTRSYQLGGRSLVWGRQCYRWSDLDFAANQTDGHGVDWPIRYADIAPYYDRVEEFIGVSGSREGLATLPDGHFQPPMALNVVEQAVKESIESRHPDRKLIIGRTANLTEPKPGRSACQYRAICQRGCSYGAYFSTQSSTLPAAVATGNLTLLTDTLVEGLDHDPVTGRISGVRTLNTTDGGRARYTSRVVFLNAGSFNTVALMLRSTSEAFPTGLANRSSGVLGQYILDHATGVGAVALMPGFEGHTTFGNRPNGIVMPRFRNVDGPDQPFLRGYSFQGGALQSAWNRGGREPGVGADLKSQLHGPGGWRMVLVTFAECLPRKDNRLSLHRTKTDPNGSPLLDIQFSFGENETRLMTDAAAEARNMLEAAGGTVLFGQTEPGVPGSSIHEMGGARMGYDRATSILNKFNQAHDVPNLFVTDGAAMASSACQNPSLTYMALTLRAAETAGGMIREGVL